MWLIIRNSRRMFHYAPSRISSTTNDRIKAPDIPEGQVQKDYQQLNPGDKTNLQPKKTVAGRVYPIYQSLCDCQKIGRKSKIYKSGELGLWQSLTLDVIVYKLWQILVQHLQPRRRRRIRGKEIGGDGGARRAW